MRGEAASRVRVVAGAATKACAERVMLSIAENLVLQGLVTGMQQRVKKANQERRYRCIKRTLSNYYLRPVKD